ncbi:prepilin-type N-terminal cleavage/methylation domain-containing protein [Candidatus Gribaldobacteria bacterium]|nr:prepilin-type N-terminal cleavage/methylation domain-containing protein [Candidatus Gribaldobacteria bacterium]
MKQTNFTLNPKGSGFTLLELLVVISIMGVLASMVLATFPSAQKRARVGTGFKFSDSLRGALQSEMIGYWNLNETSGTTAKDSYFHQLNGTIYNGPTWVQGIMQNGLNFDGVDDYLQINIANSYFKTIHGPSTIELWVKPTSLSGTKRIFSDSCLEWGLYHSGNTIYGIAYSSINGGIIETNTWYHLALVHSHPTGLTNTKIEFYVNGSLKGSSNLTITSQNGYTDSPYYVGSDQCSSGYNFAGIIDEVKIYGSGLTAQQVQQLYAEGALKRGLALK